MIRFLACAAALIPALTLGCDQSLFASDPDDGQNGRDGGPPIDGNVVREDGGGGGGEDGGEDGGGEPPDPDGTYVEIYEGPDGAAFLEMQLDTWNGIEAWVATDPVTGDVRSAAVNCPSAADNPECMGIPEGAWLFVSTSGTYRPAVLYDTGASEASSVTINVDWLVVEARNAGSGRLRFARNHPFDVVSFKTLLAGTPAESATIGIDVVADDSVLVIPDNTAPAGARIAMAIELTRAAGEGLCQVAIPFQGDMALFPNGCGPGGLRNQGAVQATTAPPRGIPGSAMSFMGDSYMSYEDDVALGPQEDGSLQLWALLDGTVPAETQWLVSNLDCTQEAGVAISYSNQMLSFEIAYEDAINDYCVAPPADNIVTFPAPTDGQWHLYRMSWGSGGMSVCVDGRSQGSVDVLGAIGTPGPLQIGRREALPARLHGQIADVRMYREPLNCLPASQ